MDSLHALKTFEAADFGHTHPKGGLQEHRRSRLQVLERLRLRSEPLPADLANDWEWFKKNWDAARLLLLDGHGVQSSATLLSSSMSES